MQGTEHLVSLGVEGEDNIKIYFKDLGCECELNSDSCGWGLLVGYCEEESEHERSMYLLAGLGDNHFLKTDSGIKKTLHKTQFEPCGSNNWEDNDGVSAETGLWFSYSIFSVTFEYRSPPVVFGHT